MLLSSFMLSLPVTLRPLLEGSGGRGQATSVTAITRAFVSHRYAGAAPNRGDSTTEEEMILKLGSSGPDVRTLIDDLRRLGFGLPAGNMFDAVVRRSVEAFQVANLDASGAPLVIDGKVGTNTRWALDAALNGRSPQDLVANVPGLPGGGSASGRAALQVALAELAAGNGEVGGDNRGPHVTRYLNGQAAAGSSWCAGFVSYCFRQGLGRNADFGYIVGAQALHNKMRALGNAYAAALSNPPQPGDIIAWRRVDPTNPAQSAWKGHIGIVHSFADGILWTVEGNRGPFPSRVKAFRYSWSALVASLSGDRFKGLYGLSRHP
jgi:peptidoglycan hydrolase-like protein with peptidoglycan-binding domain